MRFFQTAIAPLLAAAVAVAAPAPRDATEDPSFLISLTFEDGTTSGIFKVADSIHETALSKSPSPMRLKREKASKQASKRAHS